MQILDALDNLFLEGADRRCRMKVQITAKDFVGALARKDHFDAGRLDLSREKIHWRGCSNRCDVIGLKMMDYVGDCVQSLLNCERIFMMDRPQKLGDLSSGEQIW